MSARKPFDRELFEKYDAMAKEALFKITLPAEYDLKQNPKKRGVDILGHKNGVHTFNIEVEIKRVWYEDDEFPYNSVNLPERKEKYCLLDKPTVFMMFNATATSYLTFTSETVLASNKEMVHNKMVRYGELFFKVPLDKITMNELLVELEKLK